MYGRGAPVEPFISPFLGKTVEEVRDWFDGNTTRPECTGYMHHRFLFLDAQNVDDGKCIFKAVICEMGQAIEEGVMGSFMGSGTVMTKENLKLAESGDLYIERGEVK